MRFLLFLVVCSFFMGLSAQEKGYRNTIRYGVGFGSYRSAEMEGSGAIFNVGYMRSFKNPRARINPYFSSGGYGSQKLDVEREQWFTSRNVGCNIYYDVIDETDFAIVLGTGLLVNYSKGLQGNYKDDPTMPQQSQYVTDAMMGGYFGAGFRIKNYRNRFYIDAMPLNINFGKKAYLDLYATVNFNVLF
jgi:hypothetical protein